MLTSSLFIESKLHFHPCAYSENVAAVLDNSNVHTSFLRRRFELTKISLSLLRWGIKMNLKDPHMNDECTFQIRRRGHFGF